MKERSKIFNNRVNTYLKELFPEGAYVTIENQRGLDQFEFDTLTFYTDKNEMKTCTQITLDTSESDSVVTFDIDWKHTEYTLDLMTGDYENVTLSKFHVPEYPLFIKILNDIRYMGNNALSFIMSLE
jgi:hypothetical protein